MVKMTSELLFELCFILTQAEKYDDFDDYPVVISKETMQAYQESMEEAKRFLESMMIKPDGIGEPNNLVQLGLELVILVQGDLY